MHYEKSLFYYFFINVLSINSVLILTHIVDYKIIRQVRQCLFLKMPFLQYPKSITHTILLFFLNPIFNLECF